MELLASLETAIKQMIATEVARCCTEHFAGMIENRVKIEISKLPASLSVDSVASVVKKTMDERLSMATTVIGPEANDTIDRKINKALERVPTSMSEIKEFVNYQVDERWGQKLEAELAPFVDGRIAAYTQRTFGPAWDEHMECFQNGRTEALTNHTEVGDMIAKAIAPLATKEGVAELLGNLWSDDIEDRVTRLFETHEEDFHSKDSLKEDVADALYKVIEDGDKTLENLVIDVVKDRMRFRVSVD